jgi:1,2-diacylglycerol 3-alpha-glucosyltransferase
MWFGKSRGYPSHDPSCSCLGRWTNLPKRSLNVAENLLGRDGFSARSVTYEEVFDYYRAVDVFALASLQEGFGRVYVEALMHGLPVIAHRHPVMEYVLGGAGYLGDLNREGELAQLLGRLLPESPNEDKQKRRWMSVRDRFAWPTLAPQYAAMFAAVARQNVTTQS